MSLSDTFTSTGAKFFAHQEAMQKLRNGRGQPITCHIMSTDICNHSCAFCSVQARAGDVLPFNDIMGFIDILMKFGLKSCILSGGGNPILYRCKQTGKTFNDVVDDIHARGLEIGLITNGMPMHGYEWQEGDGREIVRRSWKTVHTRTLDKLTWIRVSMSGLDHEERKVYVPDIDPSKTTLGFSYVGHDVYVEPADKHHGKVSRPADLRSGDADRAPDWTFEERMVELAEQIAHYVRTYSPRYVRLLPNCLEPELIPARCRQLQGMATAINFARGVDREVAFVQHKPPAAPHVCLLGAVHPVLNADGYCYPCDSCVLNETAGHAFSNPWRMCHWSEIGKLYESGLPRSLIDDPSVRCPGCVFPETNRILEGVRDGSINPVPPLTAPEHVNFV